MIGSPHHLAGLEKLSPPELLSLHAAIAEELRRRNILRSSNNPTGDLAEYLCCRAFGWTQTGNATRDVDAIGADKLRYQIKARRMTSHNKSPQLGALRDLPEKRFDFLVGVVFHEDYRVRRVAIVPHARVCEIATPVERTNSYRFLLRDSVWAFPDVRDATAEVQAAEMEWASELLK